jgi:chromosomal replication initiator protein
MRTTYILPSPANTGTPVRENTIEAIKHAVAYFFGMPVEELHHNNTTRAVTVPRQIAMYLVKQMTDASLPEIGRRFGGKHHSTVMHAIARIEERRHQDAGLDYTISRLVTNVRCQVDPPKRPRAAGTNLDA